MTRRVNLGDLILMTWFIAMMLKTFAWIVGIGG